MDLIVKKLSEDESLRLDAAKVYLSSFYDEFKFYHKNIDVLAERLADIFDGERVFVATLDGAVAGLACYSDNSARSVKLSLKKFVRRFGLFKGVILYIDFKANDGKKLRLPPDTAFLEGICVKEEFKGLGVAGKILGHAIEKTDFKEYRLLVHRDNAAAIKAYAKAGFVKLGKKGKKFLLKKNPE